jgi:hypothetical protein
MGRARLDSYVAYVHWDGDHESPPIGPFEGITAAKAWARNFRKLASPDRPFSKIAFKVLVSPIQAEQWMAVWAEEDD